MRARVGSWSHGVIFCQLLSFQDLVIQNVATAAARGPAHTAASPVCTFFSSSKTTQGELDGARSRTEAVPPFQAPASVRQGVCPRVSQGLLGRPPAVQKVLLLL